MENLVLGHKNEHGFVQTNPDKIILKMAYEPVPHNS
jgi:hypothetical protein